MNNFIKLTQSIFTVIIALTLITTSLNAQDATKAHPDHYIGVKSIGQQLPDGVRITLKHGKGKLNFKESESKLGELSWTSYFKYVADNYGPYPPMYKKERILQDWISK